MRRTTSSGSSWRWGPAERVSSRTLTDIGRPDVGIVTSVAMAHVEFFGDLEGVARAKSELVAALPPTGVAVLNFGDPLVARMAWVGPVSGSQLCAGRRRGARRERDPGRRSPTTRFHLSTPWGASDVRLALHGIQQVPNALAALRRGTVERCPVRQPRWPRSGTATGSPLRMEVRGSPAARCWWSISAAAAGPGPRRRCGLSQPVPAGRRLALLGLMAELGSETEREHRRAAQMSDKLGSKLSATRPRSTGPCR